MLLAAGAMQYPTKKFLGALAAGRGARYTILAFLGAHYGRGFTKLFSQYYMPTLLLLIAFSLGAALYGLWEYKRRKRGGGSEDAPKAVRVRRRAA